MKNKDCTILVCSCDSYRDIEGPFIALWRKYWPDCPFESVLLSETRTTPGFDRAILAGRGKSWCEMLAFALESLSTPYVIMLMNDYLLSSRVDTPAVLRRIDDARRLGAASLRLVPNPPGKTPWQGSDLFEMPKNTAYCVSCQVTIWRRDFLLELARGNSSAWEFERCGSFQTAQQKRPLLVTGQCEFHYVDSLHKGYWERKGLALCEANGVEVDAASRTLPPISCRIREAFKAFCYAVFPVTQLVKLQNFLTSRTR